MPSHVLVDGLGLTYKGTVGVSTATLPDVCKTPSPGGPVPLPYPNFASQSSLKGGTTTVKAKGKMIAVKGSHYGRSNGDEPGTAGGVKSGGHMKATDWITYSFDVKMDGKNACRHTDKKFHNNKNTADLAGNTDPVMPAEPPSKKDCSTAIKILSEPFRLAEKLGINLSEARKLDLRRKINDMTITSHDLPGKLQKNFPGNFQGKSLKQVRAECGKSK